MYVLYVCRNVLTYGKRFNSRSLRGIMLMTYLWRKTYHNPAVNTSHSYTALSRFYPSRDLAAATNVTAELHRARRPNGLTSVRLPRRAPRCIQLPANDDLGPLGNDRLVDRLQSKQSRSGLSASWRWRRRRRQREDIRKDTPRT